MQHASACHRLNAQVNHVKMEQLEMNKTVRVQNLQLFAGRGAQWFSQRKNAKKLLAGMVKKSNSIQIALLSQ